MITELYIVPDDSRYKSYFMKIKSIGHKYITTVDGYKFIKTTAAPYYSTEDYKGWNPRLTAYESKEQLEKIKEFKAYKIRCKNTVTCFIDNCNDIQTLNKLLTFVNTEL